MLVQLFICVVAKNTRIVAFFIAGEFAVTGFLINSDTAVA